MPTPLLYLLTCSGGTMLASSTALDHTYPGVPDFNVVRFIATSLPNLFSKLAIMVGCPNHALDQSSLQMICAPR